MKKNNIHIFSRFDCPVVSGLFCSKQSFVQPQFAGECDISNILAKFDETGILPQRSSGVYADVFAVEDLQTLHDVRNTLVDIYQDLPPAISAKFADFDDFSSSVVLMKDDELSAVLGLSTSPHAAVAAEQSNSAASNQQPVDPVGKPVAADGPPQGGTS